MFDLPAGQIATTDRVSVGHGIGEIVATAGLVLLIFALARTGRAALSAAAVGAYIGAAYWFTSSTSFANPAVTVGRMFSDTFAGIAPGSAPCSSSPRSSAPPWASALVHLLFPDAAAAAGRVVVPHANTVPPPRRADAHVQAECAVRLRPQRRPLPDGRRVPDPPVRRVRSRCDPPARRPAESVNPAAVQAMAEVGIDITAEKPKILTDQAVRESDVVITMGCGDTCPFYPGKRYEDWVLDDPAGKGVESVRPIRDEIRRRVENLLDQLVPA